MKFSQKQKAILIGIILGDGFLQKTGAKNARLRLEHSEKQKSYLVWKIEQFPKLFEGKPKLLTRLHPKSMQEYQYIRAQSNSTPELGKLRKLFYPDHIKHIPPNLIDLSKNTITWAVWYMDDGYYYFRDKSAFLYLGKINKREAEIAKEALKNNLQAETQIKDKKNKGFALYFSPNETKKFHKKIKSYILPMFHYKLAENLLDPVTTDSPIGR